MTGSERPSPEPLLKERSVPSRTGGKRILDSCSGAFKCLELQGLGHPSRTRKGNSRKRSESVSGFFPEFFRNFLRKVPAVLGVWRTHKGVVQKRALLRRVLRRGLEIAFEKLVRRVLRRCLAVGFRGKKGSEKGS